MEQFDIYRDIAERTNGDIYIGIAGPVRTGKSTFIRRFMEQMVLPNITNNYIKERARDELPLIGQGKVITTTEPKFVPNEAVEISLSDNMSFRVRLIDCVGYIVDGAEGQMDGEVPRLVNTPWSDKPMPLAKAAEIGTNKVINDHSTIAIAMTTDGSITDIPRENYIKAEEDIISELKKSGKPFVLVLNTSKQYSPETGELKTALEEKYNVPVIAANCAQLKLEDIAAILEKVLYEFPIKEISMNFPKWLEGLDIDHWLKSDIIKTLKTVVASVKNLRGIENYMDILEQNQNIRKSYIENVRLGEGSAEIDVAMNDSLFYRILSETMELPIENDYELITTMRELSLVKKEYSKIQSALADVRRKGYGIVGPCFEDVILEEPEVFKHGSRFGIKIKAHGEAISMIKTTIETDVSPIVGTEEQSREFINDIINTYKTDPEKIWDLNLFGRTLDTLVNEGMRNKICTMPEDAQLKLQETLQKIINEGSGGLICILL